MPLIGAARSKKRPFIHALGVLHFNCCASLVYLNPVVQVRVKSKATRPTIRIIWFRAILGLCINMDPLFRQLFSSKKGRETKGKELDLNMTTRMSGWAIRDCGVIWLPGLARNNRDECGVDNRTEAANSRGFDEVKVYIPGPPTSHTVFSIFLKVVLKLSSSNLQWARALLGQVNEQNMVEEPMVRRPINGGL